MPAEPPISQQAALREIRRRGRASAKDLRQYFSVGRQTLSGWLQSIDRMGLTEMVEAQTRGTLRRVAPDLGFAVGVDMAARGSIRGAAFDLAWRPITEVQHREIPSSSAGTSQWSAVGLYDEVADLAVGLIAQVKAERSELSQLPDGGCVGVGLAVAAPVWRKNPPDSASSRTGSPWILRTLAEDRPAEEIALRLVDLEALGPLREGEEVIVGAERVCLISHGSAGALAARAHMQLHDPSPPPRDFVYLRIADGIGAGLVVNYRLAPGNAGLAGEIGHFPVNAQGVRCDQCGNRGCLATVASTKAIDRTVMQSFEGSREQPTLSQLKALETGAPHPSYVHALREAGWYTGVALAYVTNLLNPQLVLFDGEPDGPVHQEAFQAAVHNGLERHALGPSRRHLLASETRQSPLQLPENRRGLLFGVGEQLNLELPHEVSMPMVGAAIDVGETHGEAYLNQILASRFRSS